METVEPELKIAEPPIADVPAPPSFREHHDNLDHFVADCNAELRKRGFHCCEAYVHATWQGQAVLSVNSMTNGNPPIRNVNCPLPLPWTARQPLDLASAVTGALGAIEKGMIELCGRDRALRIAFNEFGRRVSQTIQSVVVEQPPNGRHEIVTP